MAAFHKIQTIRLNHLNRFTLLNRFYHVKPNLGFDSPTPNSSPTPRKQPKNVAIFWDLDNKPPSPFRPFEAALKLKRTASSFGFVRDMIAYAKPTRDQRRRNRTQLENTCGESFHCGVCGRNFYNHEKLVNHFKQIHERENSKRLNQIDSARGSRRVKLVAKYSMKMDKYKKAVREVLTPKVGFGLGDELERAGFWVGNVGDRKSHMVAVMEKRSAECLVLVSDDYGFVEVLQEAKKRCVKTVVVGDRVDGGGGALKRFADSGFCWREIMMWKAKKEAVSVVRKWKDRDVLERLEWRYDPEMENKSLCGLDDDDGDDCEQIDKSSSWWELASER